MAEGRYHAKLHETRTTTATEDECFDSATGTWFIINIYEGRRKRADPEVSRVLEEAYQKRRIFAFFNDKDTKSGMRANLETRLLYVEGISTPHAHLEREISKVPLKGKKEGTINTAVDGNQSVQTSNENKDPAEPTTRSQPEDNTTQNDLEVEELIQSLQDFSLKDQKENTKDKDSTTEVVRGVEAKIYPEKPTSNKNANPQKTTSGPDKEQHTFKSLDQTRSKALLRESKAEAAKQVEEVGKTDQKKQHQLQKEFEDRNRNIQEFSKKLCEEGGTGNNTGGSGHYQGDMAGTGRQPGGTGQDSSWTYGTGQSPDVTNGGGLFHSNMSLSGQFHNDLAGNSTVLAATGGTMHIESESNHLKFIDMHPGWVELFQRYGTDVIENIKKQYHVNIDHNDSGKYHINGEKKDAAEAETFMKRKVSVQKCKVEESSACEFLASQDGNLFLRETEDTCKCIINISDKTNKPLQWENKPFYYDGWCQTYSNKRITIVLGRMCDLESRMVVIPSNGCCYPVKDFGDCFKDEKEVMKECIHQLSKGSQKSKMNLWDTFFNCNTGSLPYSIICHAVFVDDSIGQQKESAKKQLKEVYKLALEKAKYAQLNSLAIPLCDYGGPSVDDQLSAIKKTMKHFLTSACCKTTKLDEIFVCVTEKKEANLVQKMMEDLLSKLEDKPLSRLVFDVSKKVKGLTRQRKNHIRIKLEFGRLHEKNADVLVNTTSLDLDLKQGLVSRAILDAAGPELQQECRKRQSLLDLGEFVITGPGKLNTCKWIFHGALPMWDPMPAKCEQVLKCFVKNCLLEASRYKMKSIAFPSLGTGQLYFPWHQVAKAMYESVEEFERENGKTSLEMIMFVIYPRDEMSKEAFIIEEKRQSVKKKLKAEKLSVQQCRNNKETLEGVLRSNNKIVKIKVCEGDMTEEPFDCTLIWMDKCDHYKDNCPTKNIEYYSAAATSDSTRFHNEFKIHVKDEDLCKALQRVFESASKKRHTMLSIQVGKRFSKMSAGAKVEQIIKALIDQIELEYLLEVSIFVSNSEDLTNVESHVGAMNLKKSGFLSSLTSLASLGDTPQFDCIKLRKITKKTSHYPQPPFEVSVQGFSVESCEKAIAKIKKHISGSDADSSDENDGMDDDGITSVFEIVRAEVNPGFLAICSDVGVWQPLMNALKTKTKMKMTEKDQRLFIEGTINQVILSEKLLPLPHEQEQLKFVDNHFQDEPCLTIAANFSEYMAILHSLNKIPESGLKKMSYKEGCIRITCNENSASKLKDFITSLLAEVRRSNWEEILLDLGEEITSSELPQDDSVMVLYDKKERKVILFSKSTECLGHVKHKIMVLLGRVAVTGRRKRDLGLLHTSVVTDSSLFLSLDSKTNVKKSTGPPESTFLTVNGIMIKVYSMPITETGVECIVNATDIQLKNSFGVSKAIADAAGRIFRDACENHLIFHGPLKIDEPVIFPPGLLKCKCIINIAGPVKFKQEGINIALSHLENIIVESLKAADGRGFKSIAFPSVSAGLAGFEAELCAQQYCKAVKSFSQQAESPLSLKEIHFVDIKTSMTQVIQAKFSKYFPSQTSNVLSNPIKGSQSFGTSVSPLEKDAVGHTKYYSIPTGKSSYSAETNRDSIMSSEKGIKGGDGMFYYPHEKTIIKFDSGDICDIETDALVSIEDENGSGNGSIAKALLKAAGSRYQEAEHSKVKMAGRSITEVVVTGAGRLKCEFVLHAIAPRWGIETTRENKTFQKNVETTMINLMDAACEKRVKCIAVPLIGIFTDEKSEVPLTICCEAMIAGLHIWIKSHSQEYQFNEVILICSNPVASKCFADVLSTKLRKEDIEGGRSTRGIPLKSSELPSRSDISMTSSSNTQDKENCVICMESITDPKVLPKCGHTFCKECINQQFMYKPVCPCCGVVYGKITGSQPEGTMQVFNENYSLPGFEGCSTIVIFYEFTGGIQKEEHPHPGRPYQGTKRKAFLPNNARGNLVLRLLREAFNRRLVFTIGTSRTTGQEDTVTWNDIHHKTSRDGGPQKYGYPDETYLDRVMEELAVKGVTKESL